MPEIVEGDGVLVGLELRNDAKVQELGVLISDRPILNPFQPGLIRYPLAVLGDNGSHAQGYGMPGLVGNYRRVFNQIQNGQSFMSRLTEST